MSIDVGTPAIVRPYIAGGGSVTYIVKENPANDGGTITSVEIYVAVDTLDVVAATFEKVGTNSFTARDSYPIGTVLAGAKRTFPVSLNVQAGDYLGIYASYHNIYVTPSGEGFWIKGGDQTTCVDKGFNPITPGWTLSIYGSGGIVDIASITTLNAYSVTLESAYLAGRIALIGEIGNCTRRGFKYGKTTGYGSDVHEDGSYGDGDYALQITGLDVDETYHFQAYVIDANEEEQVGADKTFTTETSSWNIETLTYENKSLLVSGNGEFYVGDIILKPDGTKMYVMSFYNVIRQFALTTPYDIETAVYEKSGTLSESATHHAFFISPDGTKVYVRGAGATIYQYSISAWNISTLSPVGSAEMRDEEGDLIAGVSSIFFKPDGSKLFALGQLKDSVFQISLSSSWNITTIAWAEASYNLSARDNFPQSIFFKPDGSRMYYRGGQYDTVISQYSLLESWSISTLNYEKFGSITTDYPDHFFIDPSGTRVYILTDVWLEGFYVYQYALAPDAPTDVIATSGEHMNKVVITWEKSENATAYQVYRDNVALGWLGDVDTYNDTGADAPVIVHGSVTASDGSSAAHVALSNTGVSANNGTVHTYKVKAKNVAGESNDSITDTGFRGQVSVLTYQWYRSAGDSDTNYFIISGATSDTYTDTGTPAGSVPGTPTGLAATDGVHKDKVALLWTNVSGAVGAGRYYKCFHTAVGTTPGYTGVNRGYRGAYTSTDTQVKRDITELEAIGSLATSYNDTGADAPTITPGVAAASDGSSFDHVSLSITGQTSNNGTTHSYYVRTYNEVGWGSWTAANTGYRGVGSLTYQWQRSAEDSDASYSNISGATSDTHNDTAAPIPIITPGITIASDGAYAAHVALSLSGQSADGAGRYYVCILNADGSDEETSSSDRGYRSVGDLTYQWQRSAADSDVSYSNISSATAATYNDTGAPSDGSGRYYKCVEDATGADQQISAADRGHRITLATVTTQAVSNIGEINAIGNGTITDIGYEHCSKRGVCWNTTGSPTVADDTSEETDSFGTGAFTRLMTGLTSGTTYYVKGYAFNSAGYSYGGEVEFTTITTQAATVITLAPDLVEDGIANLRLNLINKDELIINPVGWYCDENATPSTEYTETNWRAGGGGADLALGIYSKYVKTLPVGQTTLYVQAWCDDDGSNRYTGSILSFDIPSEPEYTRLPDIIFPELPDIPAIEIDLPNINYNIGLDLYLDRTYTRKDLEELRRKCINYEKNYIDFCLILNHNTLLVKNFLQSAYNNGVLGGENEMFTKIYPSQQLTPLYLEPLEPNDFKGIINRFINNNTSNSMGLNHNFDLFTEWLNDYNYTSDGYKASYITPREEIITNNEPTVKYLTSKINKLQREVSMASREIKHNFDLMKEIIQ